MGRPKGRNYKNIIVAVTDEQIQYLDRYKNRNAIIREAINLHRAQSLGAMMNSSRDSKEGEIVRGNIEGGVVGLVRPNAPQLALPRIEEARKVLQKHHFSMNAQQAVKKGKS